MMKMKKLTKLILLGSLMFGFTACDNFLNVTPIDALSGNNFWKTKKDAESYMGGIYTRLRSKVGNSILIPALDMRANFVKVVGTIDNSGNGPVNNVINNNLKPVFSGGSTYDNRFKDVMNWKGWYDVIAASNILIFEIDKIPSSELSDKDRRQYKAEATFTRNLSYMFLIKIFGDAVYYTDAYHSEALPRMNQVEVAKLCIEDVKSVINDLPVKYSDNASTGFRPTKGAAIALLMHLNMWAAAWDETDKNQYYQAVVDLGQELASYTDYQLLPLTIENTKKIFKGKTSENLFGVLQEYNYGETFAAFANPSFFFSHYPYRGQTSKTTSFMAYEKEYIEKLFPVATPDERRAIWFENMSSDNNTFQLKKFINIYSTGTGANLTVNNDDSAIIFRLPDALLLVAEAHAELGNEDEARGYVNQVRNAAGAPAFTSSGQGLKDDIYKERSRELIGEGHFFFDLVRTKRAVSTEFSNAIIPVGNFNSGAWTWPLIISSQEASANPSLIGNTFWN
ncbi:RagB/SusD family nutrient uptake outer membrane protein [Sphingobacterium kyonggiense]|uniref:RagB/SusD family nutrient uptake outer membrane protein n=2 Tax=Sphingobacterium kyonggiense TaxID=714075 RepID=A0ABP7YQS2_9SPHI